MTASCKRKAGDDLEIAENSACRVKPAPNEGETNWCTCCQEPHTNAEAADMKRGGDGRWYCSTCWSEWWSLREDDIVPPVCRVLPKWCERNEQAFHINFPEESTLGISRFIVLAGSTTEAVELFFKHGFVILRGVLSPQAIHDVLCACRAVRDATCAADPQGLGNRGRGRYSLHHVTAPGDCLHLSAFTKHLVDNAAVLDTLDAIYAEAAKRRKNNNSCAETKHVSVDASENSSQPYMITGSGGDFCQGWTSEFQPLHSDYGRARPLRPPSWAHEDFPVHDKESPPVIAANFVVQPLNRWNGAMRVVPWSEMAAYVDEVSKMECPSVQSNTKTPRFAQDRQTFLWDDPDLDLEVAPDLAHEFERRQSWLASKIFPLDAGDVLIRDTRLWHGGCPNLSCETRFLPSIEASSKALVDFFASRGKTYPKRTLPGEHMKSLSERAKKLCSLLAVQENDGYLSNGLDDCSWLKWKIGSPARRNHFLPGLQLQHDQIGAISLRACLEQFVTDNKLLSLEQAGCLKFHLMRLSANHAVDVRCGSSAMSLASEILRLLGQRQGPSRHIFACNNSSRDNLESTAIDGEIASKVAMLLALL